MFDRAAEGGARSGEAAPHKPREIDWRLVGAVSPTAPAACTAGRPVERSSS